MANKTDAQKEQELRNAGWSPSAGDSVAAAWARTATPADQGYQPQQPQNPGTPVDAGAAARKAAQEAQVLAGFKESSGFSREELAERKRQFDAEMSYKEAQWQREGLPRLEIEKRRAALEEQRFQEEIRQFNSSQGMDALKFASTLRGPSDYFQSVDFNRGAQATGNMPTFLGALASNTQMPSFQSAGTVAPTPLSMNSLANGLTGATGAQGAALGYDAAIQARAAAVAAYQANPTTATQMAAYNADVAATQAAQQQGQLPSPAGQYNTDQALAQVGSIFKGGGTGLAVGSLERLDPNELALMKSGADKLGYDWDSWVRGYQKSGVGQTAGGVI